jgi:hypothetical protein
VARGLAVYIAIDAMIPLDSCDGRKVSSDAKWVLPSSRGDIT